MTKNASSILGCILIALFFICSYFCLEFVKKAIELKADVLLVSQTVTQKDIHVKNLTELVELLEAEEIREKIILICGGARITNELAKELGYDAGFGPGTYAEIVASFFIREFVSRKGLPWKK